MRTAKTSLRTAMKLKNNRCQKSLRVSTLVLAAGLLFGVRPVRAQFVNFPDPNLEEAITNNLYPLPAPYTPAQLQALTNLYAGDYNIQDTEGLEYASNLTYVALNGDPVTNFAGIAGLTNLTEIDCWVLFHHEHLVRDQFAQAADRFPYGKPG